MLEDFSQIYIVIHVQSDVVCVIRVSEQFWSAFVRIIYSKQVPEIRCLQFRFLIAYISPYSIRCLIDAMNRRLKKLFYSTFIWINLCLFAIVESAPHQISKEHCKRLSYCHYRGICEVRNSTSGNDVEYFCQCYEV